MSAAEPPQRRNQHHAVGQDFGPPDYPSLGSRYVRIAGKSRGPSVRQPPQLQRLPALPEQLACSRPDSQDCASETPRQIQHDRARSRLRQSVVISSRVSATPMPLCTTAACAARGHPNIQIKAGREVPNVRSRDARRASRITEQSNAQGSVLEQVTVTALRYPARSRQVAVVDKPCALRFLLRI